MSIFTKAKKARENKKGFTLVELIVVLVILAILAAILVPALLGWIDEARKKQYVLEARSVYMAMQAVATEEYAKSSDELIKIESDTPSGAVITDTFFMDGSTIENRIEALAEVNLLDVNGVKLASSGGTSATGTQKKHNAFTIISVGIRFESKDGTVVGARLQNGTWEINTTEKDAYDNVAIPADATSATSEG